MMTAMRMKKNMLAYALPVSFIFWPPELDHSIEFCGIWGPVDHKVPPISTFSGVKLATCFFLCSTRDLRFPLVISLRRQTLDVIVYDDLSLAYSQCHPGAKKKCMNLLYIGAHM